MDFTLICRDLWSAKPIGAAFFLFCISFPFGWSVLYYFIEKVGSKQLKRYAMPIIYTVPVMVFLMIIVVRGVGRT